jgi:hypothetical protein
MRFTVSAVFANLKVPPSVVAIVMQFSFCRSMILDKVPMYD